MSYSTVIRSVRDSDLRDRVTVALVREAIYNPSVAQPDRVRENPERWVQDVMWALSFVAEAEYAYAVDTGVEHPGSNPGVISDALIRDTVLSTWPRGAH